MAKGKEKAEAKSADDGAQKPKKAKMMILVVIVVLVLAAAGGGAFFMLSGSKKGGGGAQDRPKQEEAVKPVYVALERKTYNLSSQDGMDHFLMLAVDVRVFDDKTSNKIKAVMPDILNAMLMLISSKTTEELATYDGKKKFAADIVKLVNEALHLHEGEKGATDALFTEFVIQ